MTKKKLVKKKRQSKAQIVSNLNATRARIEEFVANTFTSRTQLLSAALDPRRNINDECGYPDDPSPEQYKTLYNREAVAKRVVHLFPEESWATLPDIIETEEPEETEFEKAWEELEKKRHILSYLSRADIVSGIGRFGVLFLGLDDGLPMDQPVEGINEKTGEKVGKAQHQLLYLRVFDETTITVDAREKDHNSPRFGSPTFYSLIFQDADGDTESSITKKVHWTRVIHIADNRTTSEVYGVPRLQVVYNRVYDIRKVLSGSGEMFWKGAFPGYAFEVDPELADVLDTTTLREAFEEYANGLQRYIAVEGLKVKSLEPQIADPSKHIDTQLLVICIAIPVPMRIFIGSERGELASSQDSRAWNKRLSHRQEDYLTPFVVNNTLDRLIAVGALPEPADGYTVQWPDLNASTDEEKVDLAKKKTEALALYVKNGVEQLMPPKEFLSMVMEMTVDEVDAVIDAMNDFLDEMEEDAEQARLAAEELALAATLEPAGATVVEEEEPSATP